MTDDTRRKLRHAGDDDDGPDYAEDQGAADRLAQRIATGQPVALSDDHETLTPWLTG